MLFYICEQEVITIKDRIKQVRQNAGLTQSQFAERLNISRNYIGLIEIGDRIPSDRTIADICREFNVSEVWLRTGEGEMFVDLGEDAELTQVLAEIQVSDDDTIKDVLVAYWELEEKEKAAIRKLIDGIVRRQKERAERLNHPADS